jgi:hypothetical protein
MVPMSLRRLLAACVFGCAPMTAGASAITAQAAAPVAVATAYTVTWSPPFAPNRFVYVTPLPTVRPYIVNQGPVYSGWAVYAPTPVYAPPSLRHYPYVGPPVVQYRQRYRLRSRVQRRSVRTTRIVRPAPVAAETPVVRAAPESSPTLRNVTVKMASPTGVEEVIRSQGVVRIQGDNSVEITVFRGDVRAPEPAPAPAQTLPETERFPPAGNN